MGINFFSLFRPRREPEPNPIDEACESLISSAESLGNEQRDELARQVSKLWNAFTLRFNGIDGYLDSSDEERSEYRSQLSEFVRRYEGLQGTPQEHIHLSVSLVMYYTSLLGRSGLRESERRLSSIVASLVDRANTLERRERQAA